MKKPVKWALLVVYFVIVVPLVSTLIAGPQGPKAGKADLITELEAR